MGFFEEMRTHKTRTLKTSMLCLIFVGLGLTIALVGPTILDIQLAAHCSLEEVARILPARSGGYAVGAIITGFLLDFYDHQIVLLFFLMFSSIALLLVPHLGNITLVCVFMFLNGLGTGGIDITGNVWLIHLWGQANPPFMQILHFSYGVGAFISPFIAEPFLLPLKQEMTASNPVNPLGVDLVSEARINATSFWARSVDLMATLQGQAPLSNQLSSPPVRDGSDFSIITTVQPSESPHVEPVYDDEDIRVHWVYAIISFYQFIVWFAFLIVYLVHRSNPTHPSRLAVQVTDSGVDAHALSDESGEQQKAPAALVSSKFSPRRRLIVIVLSTLFMHAYCGVEISFGSLLAPFTVKSSLHLSKSLSSFITSLYWGTFTFFRILTLIAITHCKPRTLLLFNMVLILGSNVILLPFGDSSLWALWLGVGMIGVGCSSVFAVFLGYVEQMFPVTSRMTSSFMVAACLGEFIIPYIVGLFIETDPRVFLYVVFAYSLASFLFLLVIVFVQSTAQSVSRRSSKHVSADAPQPIKH